MISRNQQQRHQTGEADDAAGRPPMNGERARSRPPSRRMLTPRGTMRCRAVATARRPRSRPCCASARCARARSPRPPQPDGRKQRKKEQIARVPHLRLTCAHEEERGSAHVPPHRRRCCRCCWRTPAAPSGAPGTTGAWTLPKGEYETPEEPLDAARREFTEETGFEASPPFLPLGRWSRRAASASWPGLSRASSTPRSCAATRSRWSGRPDRAACKAIRKSTGSEWFTLDEARRKLIAAQLPLLERLEAAL